VIFDCRGAVEVEMMRRRPESRSGCRVGGWLPVEAAGQDEDDGLCALDEDVENLFLQMRGESADHTPALTAHSVCPVIAGHHLVHRYGAGSQKCGLWETQEVAVAYVFRISQFLLSFWLQFFNFQFQIEII